MKLEFFALFGFMLLMVLVFSIAIFAFVFWILMIVDCAKRNFRNDTEKIVWILILIFLGILGAIIYYFVIKNSNKRGISK